MEIFLFIFCTIFLQFAKFIISKDERATISFYRFDLRHECRNFFRLEAILILVVQSRTHLLCIRKAIGATKLDYYLQVPSIDINASFGFPKGYQK